MRDRFAGQRRPTPEPEPEPEPEAQQFGNVSDETTRPQTGTPRPTQNAHHYGPRTCRICLETEYPKWAEDQTSNLGISSHSSKPVYVSDDPELGRILSPCKCSGSQKYVHEGCLTSWRLANPTETRNYWQCPTCKYTYRLSRLRWANMLSSKIAQIALTIALAIFCVFVLGFVADPLLDFWFDPVGTIGDSVVSLVMDVDGQDEPPYYDEPDNWYEHFIKGFFSLGFVGIAKTMIFMSPWNWWNFRALFGGTRRQATGRDRVENMSLVFVLIGAFTFSMALWKAVRSLSGRLLRHVSDRVLDIGDGDDEPAEQTHS